MKEDSQRRDADMRPEYDLQSLRVRRLGPGRRSFGDVVRLEADVARVFPNTESVNEALRFLIRATKDNQPLLRERVSEYGGKKK